MAALAVVNPDTTHVPLCPLKALTGLDCPLCGSLRAVHALTRADVVGAAGHNLVLVLAIPFAMGTWCAWVRRRAAGETHPAPAPPRWMFPVLLVMVVAFTVVRNLAIGHWLAST